MNPRILVVDDDRELAEMIGIVLQAESFETVLCHDGDLVLEAFRASRPDLVLLDVMLPGRDGIWLCERIRAESMVPIIMLTAKTDTKDIVLGLEVGADDYVVKPFDPGELVARIRTRLRAPVRREQTVYTFGDLVIDCDTHEVSRAGVLINLTPLEYSLRVALAEQPKHVFGREELLKQVWGYEGPADTRMVNVHVQRLRAKVESDPDHPTLIVTVRGVGYRIDSEA